MAKTHKQALIDAVESIGTTKRIKYRDTIHLPVHQVSVGETRIAIYMDDEEVPEYFSDIFPEQRPEWVGSTCELREYKILIEDKHKVAYLINAARLYPDCSVLQTFDSIFTIANVLGDWRLVSRNPFNIAKVPPD